MQNTSQSQKKIYNLVGKIASGILSDEITFLQKLVIDVVDNAEFDIKGGRVWKFLPNEKSYQLLFQYGDIKEIPANYKLTIEDQEVLKELYKNNTMLRKETDQILKESGIIIYSVTGVGNIVKTNYGKFYEYVLGFNANEILQSFYDTLSIISTVASARMKELQTINKQVKIQKDIEKAAEIQRNLFPDHELTFSDFDIYGICIPDSAIGGDYFDYFPNLESEEDRIGIIVADAASKGLSAAIQSLFVSGAMKMAHRFSPKISSLFYSLNNLIYETFPLERFVTMFYCEITESSNRLVLYANAGHTEPLHFRKEDQSFRFLSSTGGVLGIVPNQKISVENIRMKPGDILLIVTDGITEAANEDDIPFGHERLIDLILKYQEYSAKEIALMIIQEVQHFYATSQYNDDKTLIVIKRKK